MKVNVQRWGNSLAVRIPKPVAVEADLAEGTQVDMKLAKGKVVLVPVRRRKPTLDELLERVTRDNLHGEVDFGPPVGKEAW